MTLALLSRCFDWRSALVVVRPETLIGWHRAGFRILWRWKSRPGWPPIPKELRELIRRIARENPVWGQERIANELLAPERKRERMPEHEAYAAVVTFACERATLKAHTRGRLRRIYGH